MAQLIEQRVRVLAPMAWLLLVVVPQTASAGTAVPTTSITEANHKSLDAAVGEVRRSHCKSRHCGAILRIGEALRIEREAQVTTMGVTRPIPWNAFEIAELRWKSLLQMDSPDAAELCQMTTRIVSNFNGSIVDGGGFIASTLVELSLRLDRLRGSRTCLQAVINALKPMPASDSLLEGVRTECIYGWKLSNLCAALDRHR